DDPVLAIREGRSMQIIMDAMGDLKVQHPRAGRKGLWARFIRQLRLLFVRNAGIFSPYGMLSHAPYLGRLTSVKDRLLCPQYSLPGPSGGCLTRSPTGATWTFSMKFMRHISSITMRRPARLLESKACARQ